MQHSIPLTLALLVLLSLPACDLSVAPPSIAVVDIDPESIRLVGEWFDENDPAEFAIVTLTNGAWSWKDGSGERPATLDGGRLAFAAGLGYKATAGWDDERDTLVLQVAGAETVYRRK